MKNIQETTAKASPLPSARDRAIAHTPFSAKRLTRASKQNPCELCGKDHGKCFVSHTGQACCYRGDLLDHKGLKACKDKDGEVFYVIADHPPTRPTVAPVRSSNAAPTVATADELHTVYSALLTLSPLSAAHHTNLTRRGLSDNAIKYHGFGTHKDPKSRRSLRDQLHEQFGDTLLRVPGFALDPKTRTQIHLKGHAGLLIPCRDSHGRIIALKVRTHNDYMALGGAGGVNSLNPAHVPLHTFPFHPGESSIRITEAELKAIIATEHTQLLTLGAPGVDGWKKAVDLALTYQPKTVHVAFDADARTKPGVARALYKTIESLIRAKQNVVVEEWDARYDPHDCNGIDDVIVHGHWEDIRTHAGQEALNYALQCVKQTGATVDHSIPEAVYHREIDQTTTQANNAPLAAMQLTTAPTKQLGLQSGVLNASVPPAKQVVSMLKEHTGNPTHQAPTVPHKPRFLYGSEAEIADALQQSLHHEGYNPLLLDRSSIWGYRQETGLYQTISHQHLGSIIKTYDGETIQTPGKKEGKPLLISRSKKLGAIDYVHDDLTKAAEQRDLKETEQLQLQHVERSKITAGFFNNAPCGMAFRNGFVQMDPSTFQLVLSKHSPDHRATFALPFNYLPDAQTPIWDHFLNEVWRDAPESDRWQMHRLLEEWTGLTILGKITAYERALVMYGPQGDNGKSTTQTVLEGLFPAETVTHVSPQDFGDQFKVSLLAHSRLNIVNELPSIDMERGDQFKAVISGNGIMAAHKHKDGFKLASKAGHVFACNTLPGTSDHTDAYWKRFILFPFLRKFSMTEQDTSLRSKLLSELPAIASSVLHSARDFLERNSKTREKFIVPPYMECAKQEWRKSTDQVWQFIEERFDELLTKHHGKIPASELYQRFREWSLSNGHTKVFTNQKFGRRLKELQLVEKERGPCNGVYIGRTKVVPDL